MKVLLSLLLSLPLLQACHQRLTYEIDVQLEDRVLVFSGSTHCRHQFILPAGIGSVHRYSTTDRYAYLNQNGQQWILEGIDCAAAMDGKPLESFRLFKPKNDRDAELFLVTKDGPYKVTRTSFDWRATIRSQKTRTPPRYNAGPYRFQKTFITELPPPLDTLLASRQHTSVVRSYISLQCRGPDGSEPALDAKLFAQLRAELSERVIGTETGILAMESTTQTWELRKDRSAYGPLDVTTWEPDNESMRFHDPMLSKCLPISIAGVTLTLHALAGTALVYIPSEKAIFTIQPLRNPQQLSRDAKSGIELWGY